MQPLIRRYVALLDSALRDGSGELFAKNFVTYLKKRGHYSLLPQIVERFLRSGERKAGLVTVAKEEDAEKYAQSIAAGLSALGVEKGAYEVRVDDRAVGGYTVRAYGKLIDRSYRSALVQLYQNVTK